MLSLRLRLGLSFVLATGLGAASGLTACGGDSASAPPGSGAGGAFVPGSGGAPPVGGAGGIVGATGGIPGATGGTVGATGGTVGAGGMLGGTETTVVACEGVMPLPESVITSFDPCTQCTGARCVPTNIVPEGQRGLLATCDEATTCVPDAYIPTQGQFQAKTCTSLEYAPGMAAEGRCISSCVPQVADQADRLPQADCAAGELCAPCWNPLDGQLTGACQIGCDTWTPDGKPVQAFTECGMGRGVCVPPDLVPEDLKSAVPVDSCTGGWLCAPKEKANDLSYNYLTEKPCAPSVLNLPEDPMQMGACVPAYIALANPNGSLLTTTNSKCMSGDICAPCVNPLDQTETGACK